MSKYTMELRTLLENTNVDINMQDYPLYTFKNFIPTDLGKDLKGVPITNFRDYLNNKIYKHFYFREIGFETGHLFSFKLNTKMEEIMVYYNQLLESTDIVFNPLWNVDLTETFTHEVIDNGTTNTTSTESGTLKNKVTENRESERDENLKQNSDNTINSNNTKTPNISTDTINAEMNTAQNMMTADEIREHSYLSKADHNLVTNTGSETDTGETTENLKTTNDNTINTTEDNITDVDQTTTNTNGADIVNNNNRSETYTRKQEGSSAGYLFTQNIEQWRKIMVNIPSLIFNDLEELFMQIF